MSRHKHGEEHRTKSQGPDIDLTERHFGAKAEPGEEGEAPGPPAAIPSSQEPGARSQEPSLPPLDATEMHFYHAAVLGFQKAQGALDHTLGIIRERRGLPPTAPIGISLDGRLQIGQPEGAA